MTDESSPFYWYDPSSVGWLHRRKRDGLEILNDDLVRILETDAELVPDPLFRDLLVEGLKGRLRAKRGRKKTPLGKLRELYIVAQYDYLLPRLQARHDRNKQRGIRTTRGTRDASDGEARGDGCRRDPRLFAPRRGHPRRVFGLERLSLRRSRRVGGLARSNSIHGMSTSRSGAGSI